MKHYYARYCKYGVTASSQEDHILSFTSKATRDADVTNDPGHVEPLSASSPAVRRHLTRTLSTGEPIHNPHDMQ